MCTRVRLHAHAYGSSGKKQATKRTRHRAAQAGSHSEGRRIEREGCRRMSMILLTGRLRQHDGMGPHDRV